MKIGSLTQTAPSALSVFVIACAIVTVGLLYVMQKSEALADNLVPASIYELTNNSTN